MFDQDQTFSSNILLYELCLIVYSQLMQHNAESTYHLYSKLICLPSSYIENHIAPDALQCILKAMTDLHRAAYSIKCKGVSWCCGNHCSCIVGQLLCFGLGIICCLSILLFYVIWPSQHQENSPKMRCGINHIFGTNCIHFTSRSNSMLVLLSVHVYTFMQCSS